MLFGPTAEAAECLPLNMNTIGKSAIKNYLVNWLNTGYHSISISA